MAQVMGSADSILPELAVRGQGWAQLQNPAELWEFGLALIETTLMVAFLAYHPVSIATRRVKTDFDAPRALFIYGLIGMVVGFLIMNHGYLIGFVLFEAAYYCEIMRSGILSISRGQAWAGYALGLRYSQTMRYIVLPQAFRNMLPILLTQTIILFQDTSLVFVVGLADFMTSAVNVAQRDSRLIELYVFAAFVYLVMCYFGSLYVKHLQQKMHR